MASNQSLDLCFDCIATVNTFLFLLSNKMVEISAGNYKTLDRIANSEDPDQTAFSEAV